MRRVLPLVVLAACGGSDEMIVDDPDDAAVFDGPPEAIDAAGADSFVPLDAPDDSFLPDLILVESAMQVPPSFSFRDFVAGEPAVVEGCAEVGSRRLLRFDTVAGNQGTLDFFMGVPSDDNPNFVFSPAHGHYHVPGFTEYRLLDGSGEVATGRKQSFCLMDSLQFVSGGEGKYHCGNQGISVSWADVYDRSTECQWIDITDIAAGSYTLEIEVNPDGAYDELDLTNNVWSLPVTISP